MSRDRDIQGVLKGLSLHSLLKIVTLKANIRSSLTGSVARSVDRECLDAICDPDLHIDIYDVEGEIERRINIK